ncbi:MAG: hypothetical protein U9N35_06725 [Euryarchaeota archaeon]|nr:hypothetical protein [Euryarchaeota archaeon]
MDLSKVFILALLLGLIFPQASSSLENYFILILGAIMFFSLLDLEFSRRIENKNDILFALFLNYIILGGFLIAAGSLFKTSFFQGFVVMAVGPPAVAVIPFTNVLKGDLRLSMLGVTLAYLSSIVIAPVVIFLVFGETLSYIRLLKTLIEFIVIPMILAYLASKTKFGTKIKEKKDNIVVILMFLLLYTIIGINRSSFFRPEMVYLIIMAFVKTFGFGFGIFYLLKSTALEKRISFALFGSFKNCALLAAIALETFGKEASLCPTIAIPFEIFLFAALGFVVGKK